MKSNVECELLLLFAKKTTNTVGVLPIIFEVFMLKIMERERARERERERACMKESGVEKDGVFAVLFFTLQKNGERACARKRWRESEGE